MAGAINWMEISLKDWREEMRVFREEMRESRTRMDKMMEKSNDDKRELEIKFEETKREVRTMTLTFIIGVIAILIAVLSLNYTFIQSIPK